MPAKIIVIRHGETDSNKMDIIQGQLDIPLNEEGIEQAKFVAEALTHEHIDVIYSSDLNRAVVTASHTAHAKGKRINTTPLLRERNFGTLHGVTFVEAVRLTGKPNYLGGKSLRGARKKI